MRQQPFFVPYGDEYLTAVATLPEHEPRGLVLLLAPTGPTRVVGGVLSAHLALVLAEAGLASVRFDYAGIGDSRGDVDRWVVGDADPRPEEARAVLDATRDALGVRTFASVGQCSGARAALALADDPDCAGTVCIHMPFLEPTRRGILRRHMRRWRIAEFARRRPALRRTVIDSGKRLLPDTTAPSVHRLLARAAHPVLLLVVDGRPPPVEDDRHEVRFVDIRDNLESACNDGVQSAVAAIVEGVDAAFERAGLARAPLSVAP
jgi:pimeloyl-ACP methyl ester carboxylesterase